MNYRSLKYHTQKTSPLRFLTAGLILLVSSGLWAPQSGPQAVHDPLGLQKSQVWEIHDDYAVRGLKVNVESVRKICEDGIKKLTGFDDPCRAWRCFISDQDVVALKFTRVGRKELATNQALAAALLRSLYRAGFHPDQFMLIGLEQPPEEAQCTRPWRYGWQENIIDFGPDGDYLARWLNEVTAIINVPSLMDDNIIGLRGTLANLTWPLIKRPGRLYMNKGDPFIPEIYALPQIRSKVRLHIVNALRILYYGGPEVQQRYVDDNGSLIFSLDPVALDRIALELIRRSRREKTMPNQPIPALSAPYLDTAQALGLGYQDLNFIDYQYLRMRK
jgi:hypothetical protein